MQLCPSGFTASLSRRSVLPLGWMPGALPPHCSVRKLSFVGERSADSFALPVLYRPSLQACFSIVHEVKIDFFPANYVVVNSDMKVMINPNDYLPSLAPARRKTFQENEGGGASLLHWAAWKDDYDAALALLDMAKLDGGEHGDGERPESKLTDGGSTPLHWAAKQDSLDVAELLLQYDASPTATNNNGDTPLSLAEAKGSVDMIALFHEAVPALADSGSVSDVIPSRASESDDLLAAFMGGGLGSSELGASSPSPSPSPSAAASFGDGDDVGGSGNAAAPSKYVGGSVQGSQRLTARRCIIKKQESEKMGFRLHSPLGFTGTRITAIVAHGPAHRAGNLRDGDLILSVQGTPVLNKPHDEVIRAIKAAGNEVHLVVIEPNSFQEEYLKRNRPPSDAGGGAIRAAKLNKSGLSSKSSEYGIYGHSSARFLSAFWSQFLRGRFLRTPVDKLPLWTLSFAGASQLRRVSSKGTAGVFPAGSPSPIETYHYPEVSIFNCYYLGGVLYFVPNKAVFPRHADPTWHRFISFLRVPMLQHQSGNVVRFDTAGVVLGTAQHIRFELPAWCSTRILKHVHVAQKKNISDRNAISCYQNTILYDTVPVSTRVSVWGAVQEDPPNPQLGARVLVGRSVVLCGYNDSERCGLLATITSCGQRDEVRFPTWLASHGTARMCCIGTIPFAESSCGPWLT